MNSIKSDPNWPIGKVYAKSSWPIDFSTHYN